MTRASSIEGLSALFAPDALTAGEGRVGGKAMGLARLVAHGAAVPEWFVLPTEHLAAHVAGEGDAAGADQAARAVRERAIADETRAVVAAGLARLGAGPYAVRSSMVGEDSAHASFAGLLESFLYLHTIDEVLDGVRACWASAYAPRVAEYRARHGYADGELRMGVVVQRMIAGDVSGVVFSANPVTRRRDQLLITGCWGLGEGVVSGACNTDELVCDRAGNELSLRVADKDLAVRVADEGAGTVEREVPAAQRAVRCLSEAQARELVAAAVSIEGALGAPQDIEWTFHNGRLFLLQARPITSLPDEVASGPPDAHRIVWDNSNIQESYCGVTTPLTFSFAARAYASVYRQTMQAVNLPQSVIVEHEEMLDNLLGLVRGRVYYNINNWYRGLLLLPSFGRNKQDLERMMGLETPVDFVEDHTLAASEKLRRAPRMVGTLARLQWRFARLGRDVDRFMRDFDAASARVDRRGFASASLPELMAVLEQLRTEMLENWHVPIINDFYVMMASGRLRRRVERACDEPDRVINDLLSAEEGIESAEPTRWLMRMATGARRDARVAEVLAAGAPLEALAALRRAGAPLAAEIDAYIDKYGDRCMGELKLETVSLREDPSFVIRILRNYLERPDLDADAIAAKERRQRDDAEALLRGRLSPLQWRALRRDLAAARRSIAARERMRLARTRMFGLFRDTYRAIGSRLTEVGRLDTPRDVFYLTVQEIEAYYGGTAVTADLAALARVRKREFEAYERDELPNRLESFGPVYHGNEFAVERPSDDARRASVLRGLGCSPGVAEAELCVILRADDDLAVNGKILTTTRTDPGWAPLFPSAAGILVERGSSLSHSAVLARELGIPAVVGVPNLLAIVRSGERVRLDGAAGTVARLEQA